MKVDRGGMGRGPSGVVPMSYEEQIKKAERLDVETVAQLCRRGSVEIHITPTRNGFVVNLNSPEIMEDYVFTRPEYVGRLMQALYNSNLEKPATTKRLRSMMGYPL